MIGRLARVPLREVWSHEAYDFTRWLQENTDVIDDVIDVSLTNVEREQSAGPFSVDLLAEDDAGNPVVIENQLEKSDHDHLGKLITYAAAYDAKVAIWIVSDPRPEHVAAVAWLNTSISATSFYLLKVEAVRIGEPPPAPLLTLIVGPSEESREVGETKREMVEQDNLRHRFWTMLLERARERTNLHASISPSRQNWVGTGAGRTGMAFNYFIRRHDGQVELYIDDRESETNKLIFDRLAQSRDQIEQEFGESLEWQRLETKRACRIKKDIHVGGYRDDEEHWPEIVDAMVGAMVRLERALRPHIDKLQN